jgi:uncharacterized circularly permuted ATP-grasp superfamily protein/uncharacterized alpha-E superfamily protein
MNPLIAEPEEPQLRPEWPYRPGSGYYDEMLTPEGRVRPQWRTLVESLATIGPDGLDRRWQEGRRLIHENGVSYNVYSDPQTTDRPWPLDPIPFILDRAEWSAIEAAVVQRATLLNAILADAHGPQRLLHESLLPPELVFPNPAFLRPCWGVPVPGNVHLHIYSVDLARSPDGCWWVIADRTESPSGAGYALENRLVSGRMWPDVFRPAQVHRLAAFFQTLRETLRGLAPKRENPRIVLLTPGPYNETYFEHAFLARYLGYTLVEGGDLTVRENRVLLKTLGGLLPVDVIVRRQDASYCDPLEFRGDSVLGVPGLMQAVRSGNVAVANALGSGLLETAAPAAFLPHLCRHLLGEELKMPTVATWWCGQPEPLEFVADHLADVVIKPVFPGSSRQPIFGARLSAAEREELIARMRAAPSAYVAQEQVALSTVPVWEDHRLQPRHMALRVYAVSSGGTYAVMPGGLTRVTSSLDNLVVSVQSGGGSKDTWAVADSPASQFSLLQHSTIPLDVSRATFDLPSRVADNLFWLGRYVERVDSAMRVARALLPRLSQDANPANEARVRAGAEVLAGLGYIRSEPPAGESWGGFIEREVLAMIYGSAERSSLGWQIQKARRAGWLLRDRISADAWRILNHLAQQLPDTLPPEPLRAAGAQDALDQAIGTLAAFSGLVMESMTRGHGWRFLDIGRRLERATQMVDLLRLGLGCEGAAESGQLEALLEIADSSLTYRSRYLTSVQADLVLDLLLLDEANPRSAAFQLARLREHIEELPETQALIRRPAEARIALSLLTAVQLTEARELARTDAAGRWANLETLLRRLAAGLRQLSDVLTRSYFNHAIASRQLFTQ